MKVKLVCDNIKLSILLNMLAASLSSVLGKGSSKKPMPFITFHIKYRVANEATARCHKTFFLPQKFQYLHREKEKSLKHSFCNILDKHRDCAYFSIFATIVPKCRS